MQGNTGSRKSPSGNHECNNLDKKHQRVMVINGHSRVRKGPKTCPPPPRPGEHSWVGQGGRQCPGKGPSGSRLH